VIQHIHKNNPNWIIFLEGMGSGGYWWGGNCAALLSAIIDTPVSYPPSPCTLYRHIVYSQAYYLL